MLLTNIMCGLVGSRMNPRVRAPDTKGASHEHLGTGSYSSIAPEPYKASELYNRAPGTEGSSDKRLGTGYHGLQHSEEYIRLYSSGGACTKYLDTPLEIPMSPEQFECTHVLVRQLFLTMDFVIRHRWHERVRADRNDEIAEELHEFASGSCC
ncbi:hypothetical protein HOY82DRAFT_544937 [Tuber indicum]|nr:hypothetical protein HOY82DRAFT_544937 [Tuber indicum]